MATRQKTKEKKEQKEVEQGQKEAEQRQKEAEAEEYLDERRAVDGQERFWSAESEVRLRTFDVEERIKNTPTLEGQASNKRFLLEAKAELERRKAVLE